MKISQYTSTIKDYEIRANYYHGKDIVHEGCLLILDPDSAWEKIGANTRKNIRRAKKLTGLKIIRVKGTKIHIKAFRTIWFDPGDKTIPEMLKENEIMYMVYLQKELIAGMILTPAGKNLFLHNLAGNDTAKKHNVTALLLWNAVEDLQNSQYKYIDVGVSFRKTLYTFFSHWKTEKYPIIFNKPFITPYISLVPFENKDIIVYSDQKVNTEIARSFFGDTYTIFPRAIYCIRALLEYLKITKKYNIAIYKTFDNNYISRCVTETIKQYCNYTRKIDNKTKAVMIIHEFGYPYQDIKKIKEECIKRKIPLIENCAWGYGSKFESGQEIGTVGDYAIYSLPKIIPAQYGGVLKGLNIEDESMWNDYRLLDYYKRVIIYE